MLKERCKGDEEQMSKSVHVDLSLLPPCKDSLHQHIRIVNYQVAIWKRAHEAIPIIPPPTQEHGWTKDRDNLEPLWSTTSILPQRLVDVLESLDDKDYSSDDDFDADDDNLCYDTCQDSDSENEC